MPWVATNISDRTTLTIYAKSEQSRLKLLRQLQHIFPKIRVYLTLTSSNKLQKTVKRWSEPWGNADHKIHPCTSTGKIKYSQKLH